MASKAVMSKEAKDLAARVRSLTKAVEEKQPAASVKEMLDSLRKEVVVTEELLRLTKAGVIVNKLKQHEDKGVQVLANQIVQKWKGEINAKTARDRAAKSSASTAAVVAAAKSTVPPLERNKDKDGVDVARTGDSTRDACIGLLYNGLCYGSDVAPNVVLKRAVDTEKAAYQDAGGSLTTAYKSKVRSLFSNLKNVKNPSLRVSVLSGEISAERLVTMTSEELASPERRAENEKIRETNIREAQVAKPEKSISTALKCGKCGQKKVSYSQAQTRSADEPMTTFCECVVCGNRWKFS